MVWTAKLFTDASFRVERHIHWFRDPSASARAGPVWVECPALAALGALGALGAGGAAAGQAGAGQDRSAGNLNHN